jgi:hypothetical protein
MGLYLGDGEKLKLNIGNTICNLIIPATVTILNNIILLSSDNYILKDSNGVYLITKEDK